jgi:hypothetical protein
MCYAPFRIEIQVHFRLQTAKRFTDSPRCEEYITLYACFKSVRIKYYLYRFTIDAYCDHIYDILLLRLYLLYFK